MKNKERERLRTDRPSGRQASDQSSQENKNPEPSTLHQGQGPDFPTQDKHLQEDNPGLNQRRDYPGKRHSAQKPGSDPEGVKKQTVRKRNEKRGTD